MRITARVENSRNHHVATVRTDDAATTIPIPPRAGGYGSGANGGELLFLALATCYCNDVYREAEAWGIVVNRVEVEVAGGFGGPGDPASGVTYRAVVAAHAPEETIRELMRHVDGVAEIHNTLRGGTAVTLADAVPVVL